MAKSKIKSATEQRPFIMIYQDFLESELLDNYYQKLLYVYLKKFADSKNQCFPSIKTLAKLTKISANKVKKTLIELEQKGVISKENRIRPDGGKSSNIYTVYDFKELWGANNHEEVASIVNEYEDKKLISLLEAKGYIVTKEKEPDTTEPTKDQLYQAPQFNQFDIANATINSQKSQEIEHYSMEEIKEYFDYDIMIQEEPFRQKAIDTVMNILYDTLNSSKKTIRISGEDKPAMVVQAKLMKLNHHCILYAIDKFANNTERINRQIPYMLTVLYHAQEQYELDITNQVQHDMANWSLRAEG